jgi:hypothetical protein
MADLRRTAAVFNGFSNVDGSWLRLIADTEPMIDLALAEHRTILLRWLNSWGCRIRYPRSGEPTPFDSGIAQWWRTWQPALPQVIIAQLTDTDIKGIGDAYDDLAARPSPSGCMAAATAWRSPATRSWAAHGRLRSLPRLAAPSRRWRT